MPLERKPVGMPEKVWKHVQELREFPLSRDNAVKALGDIGHVSAAPYLVMAIADYDPAVRRSAADALGKIGYESAVRHLAEALRDSNSAAGHWSADIYGDALYRIGRAIQNKPLKDVHAKALQMAGKHLVEYESPAVVSKAFEEALKLVRGKKTVANQEKYLGLYVKELRALKGRLK